MARHQDLTINHILESWVYANASARTSATGFVTGDIGRIAFQSDTGQYWRLTATTPTWQLQSPGDLPLGGTTGQRLQKNSATNFDASWATTPTTNIIWLTAGTTYTPSAGVRAIFVECVGGGGAGGGAATAAAGNVSVGSGGGAGAYSTKLLTGTLKGSYSYVIGAGGTAVSGAAGNNGGDTTFDSPSVCTAKGGTGGTTLAAGTAAGYQGGGPGGSAVAGVGDFTSNGGYGAASTRSSGTLFVVGGGGVGRYGGSSHRNWYFNSAGSPGDTYSCGGSGAGATGAGPFAGGPGFQGLIRITEYF